MKLTPAQQRLLQYIAVDGALSRHRTGTHWRIYEGHRIQNVTRSAIALQRAGYAYEVSVNIYHTELWITPAGRAALKDGAK